MHRIGRTGRAGRSGQAVTIAEFRDRRKIADIEHYTQQSLKAEVIPGLEPKQRAPASFFERPRGNGRPAPGAGERSGRGAGWGQDRGNAPRSGFGAPRERAADGFGGQPRREGSAPFNKQPGQGFQDRGFQDRGQERGFQDRGFGDGAGRGQAPYQGKGAPRSAPRNEAFAPRPDFARPAGGGGKTFARDGGGARKTSKFAR